MAPQTAWQLFQIISFAVGDFQGLLWDLHFSARMPGSTKKAPLELVTLPRKE